MNANGTGNDRAKGAESAAKPATERIDDFEYTADDAWAVAKCVRSPFSDELVRLETFPIGCPVRPTPRDESR